MKLFTLFILTLLQVNSAKAETFSWEEFQRNRICSKQFCQTPDHGVEFRRRCELQEGVLPPYVYVIFRSDEGCYCPCTLEYRLYRDEQS